MGSIDRSVSLNQSYFEFEDDVSEDVVLGGKKIMKHRGSTQVEN